MTNLNKNLLIAAKNERICGALKAMFDGTEYSVTTATDGMTVKNIDLSVFNIIFIFPPLADGAGTELIYYLSDNSAAMICAAADANINEKLKQKILGAGAYIIKKPVVRQSIIAAADLLSVFAERQAVSALEFVNIQREFEDSKIINRAKLKLIASEKMTEEEAHKALQKAAMDSGNGLVQTAQCLINGDLRVYEMILNDRRYPEDN